MEEDDEEGSGPVDINDNSASKGGSQKDNDGEEETYGDVRERVEKAGCYC